MYAILESRAKHIAISDFDQNVEANLRGRNEEIRRLVNLLEQMESEGEREQTIRRESLAVASATLLVLYAHWEGFSKFLAEEYIRTIGILGLEISFVKRSLLSFHFDHRLKSLRDGDLKIKKSDFAELVEELRGGGGFLRLGGDLMPPKVSTGSNLWTRKLRDLVIDCGIEVDILDSEFRRRKQDLFRLSHSSADSREELACFPENAEGRILQLPESISHREPNIESPIDWLVGARNRLGHGDVRMREPNYGLDSVVVSAVRGIVDAWTSELTTIFQRALTSGDFLEESHRANWLAL